jgi:hypothetical protein
MAIKLGKYSFDGPFASIDKLKDKPGVYAIICIVDREFFLLDVGESTRMRTRIENHEKKGSWLKKCNGELAIFVHYTPFLEQEDRSHIEKELRDLYHPAIETDIKVLFKGDL